MSQPQKKGVLALLGRSKPTGATAKDETHGSPKKRGPLFDETPVVIPALDLEEHPEAKGEHVPPPLNATAAHGILRTNHVHEDTPEAKAAPRVPVVIGPKRMSLNEKHRSPEQTKDWVDALLATMPQDLLGRMRQWKVAQAAITKPALPQPEAEAPQPKQVRHKLSRVNTSKIHKFRPPVPFDEAVECLAAYGPADSSLVFDNHCMLFIERGRFVDFEDVRDEEDRKDD